MNQPDNLRRRAELEDRYTLREPPKPTLEQPKGFDQEGVKTTEPQSEAVKAMAPPEVPEPVNPKGIFEAITDSYRRTALQAEAHTTYADARRAEVKGDDTEYARLRSESAEKLRQASEITPGVASFENVRSLRDAAQFSAELGGAAADSVYNSILGGTAGSVIGGAAGMALALTPLGKLRHLMKVTKGSGAFAGSILPMAKQTKGSIAMQQDTDPEVAQHSVRDRELAANFTTAGSLALEGLVPSMIGGRVGTRILQQGREKAGLPAKLLGQTSGKGKLALDVIEEGATEVLQGELEAFSMHLQNPKLPTSAGLTEAVNAFLGGAVGGGMGHGMGRGMELGTDLIGKLAVARDSSPGALFGNLKIDQELDNSFARGLPAVFRSMGMEDLASEFHDFNQGQVRDEQRQQELRVIRDYLKTMLIEKGKASELDPADTDGQIEIDAMGRRRTDMYEDLLTSLGGKDDRLGAEKRALDLELMIERLVGLNESGTQQEPDDFEYDPTEEPDEGTIGAQFTAEERAEFAQAAAQAQQAAMDEESTDFGASEFAFEGRTPPADSKDEGEVSRIDSGGLDIKNSTYIGADKKFDYEGHQSIPMADPQKKRWAATDAKQSTSYERPVNRHSAFEKANYQKNYLKHSPYTTEYADAFSEEIVRNVRKEDIEYVSWGKWLEHKQKQTGRSMPVEDAYAQAAKFQIRDYENRMQNNNNSNPERSAYIRAEHQGKIDELKRALEVGFNSRTNDDGSITLGLNALLNDVYMIGMVKRQEFKTGPSASEVMSNTEAGRVQEAFNRIQPRDAAGNIIPGNTPEARKAAQDQRDKMKRDAIAVVRRLTTADRRHLAEQEMAPDETVEEATARMPKYTVEYMPRRGFVHVEKTHQGRDKTLKYPKDKKIQELGSAGLARYLARPDVVGIAARDKDGNVEMINGEPVVILANTKPRGRKDRVVRETAAMPRAGKRVPVSKAFKKNGELKTLFNEVKFGLLKEGNPSTAYSDSTSKMEYRISIRQAKETHKAEIRRIVNILERLFAEQIKHLTPELTGPLVSTDARTPGPNDEAARPNWWKIATSDKILKAKEQDTITDAIFKEMDKLGDVGTDIPYSLADAIDAFPESDFAQIANTLNELKTHRESYRKLILEMLEDPAADHFAPLLAAAGIDVRVLKNYEVKRVLKAHARDQKAHLKALRRPLAHVDSELRDAYWEDRSYLEKGELEESDDKATVDPLVRAEQISNAAEKPGGINELEIRLQRLQETARGKRTELEQIEKGIEKLDPQAEEAFEEAIAGIVKTVNLDDIAETEQFSLEDYTSLVKQYLQDKISREMSDATNTVKISNEEHLANQRKLLNIALANSDEQVLSSNPYVIRLRELQALTVDQLFESTPANTSESTYARELEGLSTDETKQLKRLQRYAAKRRKSLGPIEAEIKELEALIAGPGKVGQRKEQKFAPVYQADLKADQALVGRDFFSMLLTYEQGLKELPAKKRSAKKEQRIREQKFRSIAEASDRKYEDFGIATGTFFRDMHEDYLQDPENYVFQVEQEMIERYLPRSLPPAGKTKQDFEAQQRAKDKKNRKKKAEVKKTRWQGIVGKTDARVVRALHNAHKFSTSLMRDRVVWEQMSSRERGAAAKAFGLISTRKGLSGVNVSNLGNVSHNNVVMAVIDTIPKSKSRINSYFEKVADKHAAIVLSSESAVMKDKKLYAEFRDYMFELGYAPLLNDPQFFDSMNAVDAVRHAAEFNAALIGIQVRLDKHAADMKEDKAPEDDIWLRNLLWRLEVILADQPARNTKGGRPYDLNKKERIKLKSEYGYELKWANDFTRALRLKSVPKKEKKKERKARRRKEQTGVPPAGEKTRASQTKRTRREKDPDYISPEESAENMRNKDWADEQRKAAEGMYAAFMAPHAADTHVHMAHFFRSIGISDAERRMRRDLKRSIAKNKRIYKAVQLHLIKNPYGLSAEQKSAMMDQANENLYYGYVFQMWMHNDIKVGPTPEQWFRRILERIVKMIGGHTAEYFSEEFFTALSLGNIKSTEEITQFYKNHSTDLDTRLANMNEIMREATLRTIGTGIDVLRELNLEEANEIADLFAPGEYSQGFKGDGFLPKRQQQINAWHNRFRSKLLKKYGEDKLNEGWQQYRVGDTSTQVSRDIENFVEEFYRYLDKRNVRLRELNDKGKYIYVPAGQRKWKVPAAWDSKAVNENRGKFLKLLVLHGLTEDQAEAYIDSMLWAGGHVSFVDSRWDKENNPHGTGAFSGYSQVLNATNATDFAEFMHDDALFAINRMVQQGVHKAEFTVRFGENGAKLDELYYRLRKRGISESRLRFIKERTIPGLLGTLTYNLHPRIRRSFGTAVAMQNMAILPLILFSSMPEIWGNAIASRDFNQAFKAAKEGFAEIGRSMRHGKSGPEFESELEQLGRLVGAISDEMMTNRVTDVFNDLMAGTKIRDMNEKFFRLTMIEQWTKGLRLAAVQASLAYITDHRDNPKKLHQLGLKPEDISFHADGSLDMSKLDDPDNPVSMAIYKFVDQSVLRPSSAHRPAWGSDPRFLLVWHLKQFTFSFHQVFSKHVWKQFVNRDSGDNEDRYKILAAYMMMLPTIILSDLVKNIVAPSNWYWSGRMTFEQFMYLEVSRSGITGLGSLLLDEMLGATFNQPFGKNFMGPTFERMTDFANGNWARSVLGLTPGYVLWHKWGLV